MSAPILPGDVTEDAVSYRLFPRHDSPARGRTRDTVPREALTALLHECQSWAAAVLAACGHIWQQEPFNLRVEEEYEGVGHHLAGRTAFGDNVEVRAAGVNGSVRRRTSVLPPPAGRMAHRLPPVGAVQAA